MQTVETHFPNRTIPTEGPTLPELKTYFDYRAYLQDVFTFRRKTLSSPTRAYSYSIFAAAADIKSPNYLKMVIDGQRNLSDTMIQKFSKALQHSKSEAREFVALVHFNQTQDPAERSRLLKELLDLRNESKIMHGELKAKDWDLIPNWLAWLIVHMVDQKNVQFDLRQLSRIIRARPNADAIQKTLNSLIASGFLVENVETKNIEKPKEKSNAPETLPDELIQKLQSEFIFLSLQSLYQDTLKDREFSTTSLCLTADEFERLKFDLRQLRKKWHRDTLASREKNPGEKVFQLNIQLFPMTDSVDESP